jgi:hypothetical protein
MLNWLPERIKRQAKAELIQRKARESWEALQRGYGLARAGASAPRKQRTQ